MQSNTSVAPVQTNEDAALKSLLDDLTGPTTEQPQQEVVTTTVVANEADLEAAVATVETPAEQPATAPMTEKKAKGKGKGKTAKAKSKPAEKSAEQKAADEKAAAEAKAAKEKAKAEAKAKREAEKASKPKVVFYGNDKVRRITETFGEKLGEVLVLEVGDAALEGEALAQHQAAIMKMIGEQSVKVKNRITLLLDFVGGKTKELNEVIHRAFTVLHADGKIVAGDKGNLHALLLKKPYSVGAARAMGRNTLNAMVALKIVTKGEKGEFPANPNSMIAAKVNGLLGLTK